MRRAGRARVTAWRRAAGAAALEGPTKNTRSPRTLAAMAAAGFAASLAAGGLAMPVSDVGGLLMHASPWRGPIVIEKLDKQGKMQVRLDYRAGLGRPPHHSRFIPLDVLFGARR